MKKRWDLCINYKGRQLDKKLLRKIPKMNNDIYFAKRKKSIKYQFILEKARREVIEEDIKKLEDMFHLKYLSILTTETKEKLIGLCLDRKLMDTLDENGETIPEEDKIEDRIENEEICLE